MKKVILVANSSCVKDAAKQSFGGWAAVLKYGTHRRELYGCDTKTTHNRMELQAVIEAIKLLTMPCEVVIYSSSYVYNCLKYLEDWKQNGWKAKSGAKPKNLELIQELYDTKTKGKHVLRFQLLTDKTPDVDIERTEELAKANARALKEVQVIA